MNFRSRREVEPEINVTSLIDVILLLVMFFMVSTTFVTDGRLTVRLPQSSALPEARHTDRVVISVLADGTYRVNEKALANTSPATLRAALEQLPAEARGKPVTLRADARATHQAVVTAMDVAGRVGFTQVNIATVNQSPPDAGASPPRP
jgi:biopolymer transport protein ExbD